MPEVKGLLHDDTENAKSEEEMLEDNDGHLDMLSRPSRPLGAPQEGVSKAGTLGQQVGSKVNDTVYSDVREEQPGNETGLNGDTPEAGDVDPDSTKSAEETGQDGDPTEAKKSHGKPWDQ